MCPAEREFPGRVVTVPLDQRSYPIYVGSSGYSSLSTRLQQHCGRCQAIIITDENVGRLYGQAVLDGLRQAGFQAQLLSVAAGDASKCLAVAEGLYDRLFDLSAERRDVIVALGGGVVGDLAGFIAATFKRGLQYVQAPTTLLAMVDSSIGGKTAVNHPRGKNMIGAFYQPSMVFADIDTLKTLPRRELGCGLAETVKHAVIRDAEFFDLLERQVDRIAQLDREFMIELVVRNCRIKAAVVGRDERESGLRRILNLGHTIGHTLETVLAGHPYHHGEAVSLGMIAADRLAVRRQLLTEPVAERIRALLEAFELPTAADVPLPVHELYHAMRQDKKVQQGRITFVLPTGIGSCTFVNDLSESEIKAAIESLSPL